MRTSGDDAVHLLYLVCNAFLPYHSARITFFPYIVIKMRLSKNTLAKSKSAPSIQLLAYQLFFAICVSPFTILKLRQNEVMTMVLLARPCAVSFCPQFHPLLSIPKKDLKQTIANSAQSFFTNGKNTSPARAKERSAVPSVKRRRSGDVYST